MKRFWVSWWSGNYDDEGCTEPPFQFWMTEQRARPQEGLSDEKFKIYSNILDEEESFAYLEAHSKDDCSIFACLEAESPREIWDAVEKYFPDYEIRFCEEKKMDFVPDRRFPDFENKISIT